MQTVSELSPDKKFSLFSPRINSGHIRCMKFPYELNISNYQRSNAIIGKRYSTPFSQIIAECFSMLGDFLVAFFQRYCYSCFSDFNFV